MSYYVRAVWDTETGIYFSETNIPGLNVEAETLHEFVEIVEELAPQILEANVEGFRQDVERARPTAAVELTFA